MARTLTPELLNRRWKSMEEFYRQRNINMLCWRDLYFLKDRQYFIDQDGEYVEPEKDERRVILPIAQQYVESMRELLLTKPPAISVPAPSVRGRDVVHADHNEKVLLTIWHQANIYQEVCDSLWHGFVDGWGVLQIVWDKNAEENQSPIEVIAQDPINVYPCPGRRTGEWQYLIHCYPRTVGEIRDEWEHGRDRRTKQYRAAREALDKLEDGDMVDYIEYWDDEVFAVAINYQTKESNRQQGDVKEITEFVVPPEEHRYGFLPWLIYFPNRTPFSRIGERAGISILYIIEDLVRYLCWLVSKKATMLDRWQDPPLVTKTEDGRDFEPVRTESGMHLRLLPEESAEYLVNPTPMPQLDTQIEKIEEYIERSSLPRVLQGQYVGSISGIAMSLLRNPTLMKIAFKQKSLEYTLVKLNEMILRLVEKFGRGERYLWGRNTLGENIDVIINPKAIGGYYRNDVKLSASLPTDDANTVNMLATLVQLQVLSRQTARDVAQQTLHELLPQSLPDEQKRVLAETILTNEQMVAQLAMRVAQEVFGGILPGIGGQENPRGGYGPREVTMPARTLASQTPGMPGGNVQPSLQQRLEEMVQRAPTQTGETARAQERVE